MSISRGYFISTSGMLEKQQNDVELQKLIDWLIVLENVIFGTAEIKDDIR